MRLTWLCLVSHMVVYYPCHFFPGILMVLYTLFLEKYTILKFIFISLTDCCFVSQNWSFLMLVYANGYLKCGIFGVSHFHKKDCHFSIRRTRSLTCLPARVDALHLTRRSKAHSQQPVGSGIHVIHVYLSLYMQCFHTPMNKIR